MAVRRVARAGLEVAGCLALSGCVAVLPPVQPGFVGVEKAAPSAVDVGAEISAHAFYAQTEWDSEPQVGGPIAPLTVRFEPWLTAGASLPMEAALMMFGPYAIGQGRFGVRGRIGDRFVLGAGVGGDTLMEVVADVEIGVGGSLPRGGAWSVVSRPGLGYNFAWGVPGFGAPIELAFMKHVGGRTRIGGGIVITPGYTQETPWVALGASFIVHGEVRKKPPAATW
jgi:hypothetical protein